MKTIWKYALKFASRQVIEIPTGAAMLDVQLQVGAACLWAIADPDAPRDAVTVLMVPTGGEVPASAGNHIGTVQYVGGFVAHFFLETPDPAR